ncbi:MAG: hydrogenase maturation protease [Bacteroidales bacterium]
MTVRLLGLGNDLLADDAFGVEVLRQIAPTLPAEVQTATSIASGFALIDDLLGADRLIVIDTMTTGHQVPGNVRRFEASDITPATGQSPHYVGMFETLQLGRRLGLHVPAEIVILAVEAGDCLTIGGPMSTEMRAAIPVIEGMIREQLARWREPMVSVDSR